MLLGIIASVYIYLSRKRVKGLLEMSLPSIMLSVVLSCFGFASNLLLVANMVVTSNDDDARSLAFLVFAALLCNVAIGIYLINRVLATHTLPPSSSSSSSSSASSSSFYSQATALSAYLVREQGHNLKNAYTLIFLLMCIGSGNIIYLPWNATIKNSDFVRRSSGFPKFWVMRLSLYGELLFSLVILVVGVVNALKFADMKSLTSAPCYSSLLSAAAHVNT